MARSPYCLLGRDLHCVLYASFCARTVLGPTNIETPRQSRVPMPSGNPISYADAGVNIDAGDALVDDIKAAAGATSRSGVMGQLGGFGAVRSEANRISRPRIGRWYRWRRNQTAGWN